MNILWAILLLVGGLVILWKCAELLVSGAVGLAKRLGVSPLVIGLTVVAMGTSAPEVAASIAATVRGIGDIAIGNVYGSNIANLALVGGLASLIRPLQVQKKTLLREIPVMILVALLLWPLLSDLSLSRPEGVILLVVFVVLVLVTILFASREHNSIRAQEQKSISAQGHKGISTTKSLLFIIIGLVGLAIGADMTVQGAVFIGELIGLSKAVIGLTIIAVGTSLPELATCIFATIKGEHDISIGNLVGSNIFNTLLVVGIAGVVRPFTIVARLAGTDYWIMIFVSVGFAFLVFICRRTISRFCGAILLFGYVAYMIYLFNYTWAI